MCTEDVSTIAEIGESIDVAVIAVRSSTVEAIVEPCAAEVAKLKPIIAIKTGRTEAAANAAASHAIVVILADVSGIGVAKHLASLESSNFSGKPGLCNFVPNPTETPAHLAVFTSAEEQSKL